jgi:hypothetical protein
MPGAFRAAGQVSTGAIVAELLGIVLYLLVGVLLGIVPHSCRSQLSRRVPSVFQKEVDRIDRAVAHVAVTPDVAAHGCGRPATGPGRFGVVAPTRRTWYGKRN